MKPMQALLIAIFLAVGGQILMKLGMLHIGELTLHTRNILATAVRIFSTPVIILGLIFLGISAFLWLVAISQLELSVAYPMVAITYVLVPVLSCLIFKEHLTMMRMISMSIIILGIILLAKS